MNGLVETFVNYSETLSALNNGTGEQGRATQESATMAGEIKASTDNLKARSADLREFVALFTLPDVGWVPLEPVQAA